MRDFSRLRLKFACQRMERGIVPQLEISIYSDRKISMREERLSKLLSGGLKRISFALAICHKKVGGKWGVSVVIGGVGMSMGVTSAP